MALMDAKDETTPLFATVWMSFAGLIALIAVIAALLGQWNPMFVLFGVPLLCVELLTWIVLPLFLNRYRLRTIRQARSALLEAQVRDQRMRVQRASSAVASMRQWLVPSAPIDWSRAMLDLRTELMRRQRALTAPLNEFFLGFFALIGISTLQHLWPERADALGRIGSSILLAAVVLGALVTLLRVFSAMHELWQLGPLRLELHDGQQPTVTHVYRW